MNDHACTDAQIDIEQFAIPDAFWTQLVLTEVDVVQEIHARGNKWFIASVSPAVGRWQDSGFALRKDKCQGKLSIAVNTNEYTSNQNCVFL